LIGSGLQSTIAEEDEDEVAEEEEGAEEEAEEEEEEEGADEEEGEGAPMRMESDSSVTWRNLFLLNG
jgi:hypothetical protein